MEGVFALLGVAGVAVAILANLTSVAGFLDDRLLRRRRDAGGTIVPGEPTPATVPAPAKASPATSARATIRTPDQRVRVFVSSTLHELAAERARVRAAIEELRLTPVMFEMGARPHAPRDLYRAYLEQSDVFVGIYAERYGWVAPGESVSGLEDEYLRSGDRPKLVYVKRVAGAREAALEALLERVRSDDQASYRAFGDADELAELLADDLATLLSERFDRGAGWANSAMAPIPAVWGPLIGREEELARALALVDDPAVRLVTLLGPGGIGKSRLALEVADRARARRPDGVAFVSLQGVADPAFVSDAVAAALGVRASPERDVGAALAAFLAERDMLLVLDDFEQVVDAAPRVASLLERAPRLTILVTSRALLRLSAERTIVLAPLPTPSAHDAPTLAQVRANPAVQLFVWRARAVRPDLEPTEENARVLLDIVCRLEGWPLAILLAASRIGHLSLEGLRDRLSRRLDLLIGGARDMPQRQQTLRATIDWSVDLLAPDARALLERCSVFVDGFTLDALERLVSAHPWPSGTTPDLVGGLGALIDSSLVARTDGPTGERYAMLGLVREAALERLEASGERSALEASHARTYLDLCRAATPMVFAGRPDWYLVLSVEQENVRRAVRHAVETQDAAAAAAFASSLWLFWWMRLQAGEHLPWMTDMLARTDIDPSSRIDLEIAAAALHLQLGDMTGSRRLLARLEEGLRGSLDPRRLATVEIGQALVASFTGDVAAIERHALRARALAASCAFGWAETFACVLMARAGLATRSLAEGARWAEEGISLTTRQGDRQSEAWSRHVLGIVLALDGRSGEARDELLAALGLFGTLAIRPGEVMMLRTLAFLAALGGDAERAARLAGATASAASRHGVLGLEPELSITTQGLERFAVTVPETGWREAFDEGRAMPLDVAVRYALAPSATRAEAAGLPVRAPGALRSLRPS